MDIVAGFQERAVHLILEPSKSYRLCWVRAPGTHLTYINGWLSLVFSEGGLQASTREPAVRDREPPATDVPIRTYRQTLGTRPCPVPSTRHPTSNDRLSLPRGQLDVYYPDPAAVAPNQPVPVLFFIYGSGFVNGHRRQAPPFDLGHANVGVFFAKRGYVPCPASCPCSPSALSHPPLNV